MAGELLDYVERDNFDFFKFSGSRISGELSIEAQEKLKSQCAEVMKGYRKSVLDTCELGLRLYIMRQEGRWKHVINPEDGMRFNLHSFEKFCEYAFDFGGTLTSNLLSLAQFVCWSKSGAAFVESRYEQFNMSQLIELGSVDEWNRKYFSPAIPVKDMRLCKKYIKTDDFKGRRFRDDFNLLECAKLWDAAHAPMKGSPAPQLPGQVSLEELEEEAPEEVQEKSDVGFRQEEPTDEFDEFGADSIDYFNESETDEELDEYNEVDGDGTNESFDSADYYDDEDIEDDVVVEPTPKYNLKARDGVREFLWDYQNWRRTLGCIPFFNRNVWTYNFKNGAVVTAVERKVFTNDEFDETTDEPLYFLDQGDGQGYVEITKKSLVAWCTLYREAL